MNGSAMSGKGELGWKVIQPHGSPSHSHRRAGEEQVQRDGQEPGTRHITFRSAVDLGQEPRLN